MRLSLTSDHYKQFRFLCEIHVFYAINIIDTIHCIILYVQLGNRLEAFPHTLHSYVF